MSCSTEVKDPSHRDCAYRIENQISTWLSHEARVGVKRKLHVRMQLEPTVVPGFVGIEVVEHDVDGSVGPGGYDVIHEVTIALRVIVTPVKK
jgi:hypothetical protein